MKFLTCLLALFKTLIKQKGTGLYDSNLDKSYLAELFRCEKVEKVFELWNWVMFENGFSFWKVSRVDWIDDETILNWTDSRCKRYLSLPWPTSSAQRVDDQRIDVTK